MQFSGKTLKRIQGKEKTFSQQKQLKFSKSSLNLEGVKFQEKSLNNQRKGQCFIKEGHVKEKSQRQRERERDLGGVLLKKQVSMQDFYKQGQHFGEKNSLLSQKPSFQYQTSQVVSQNLEQNLENYQSVNGIQSWDQDQSLLKKQDVKNFKFYSHNLAKNQSQSSLAAGRQITPMTRTPCTNATPNNRSPFNQTQREKGVAKKKNSPLKMDENKKIEAAAKHTEWQKAIGLSEWEESRKKAKTPHRKYVPDQVKTTSNSINSVENSTNKENKDYSNLNNNKNSVKVSKVDLWKIARNRDFTSQIQTLPGPQNQNQRQIQERSLTPEPRNISVLKLQLYDSYYFQPAAKNANQRPNLTPEQNKFTNNQKNVHEGFKNKHYSPLHEFIYRTPLDFLSQTPLK